MITYADDTVIFSDKKEAGLEEAINHDAELLKK